MLVAATSVLTLFLLVAVGWVATRKGFFTQETGSLFSRVVVNLALPPLMVHQLVTHFSRDELLRSGRGLLIPALTTVAAALLAPWVASVAGVAPGRRGTFAAMFTASNTIFMGLPVNLALFGQAAVPYVLFFYASNTTYFWTFGVHGIEADAGKRARLLSWDHFRRMLSPPFLGFLVGLLLVLLQVPLPGFLLEALKHLGGLTTALSLIFLGITFEALPWQELRPTRDMAFLFLGRFLVGPALVFLVARLLPVPPLMVMVFMIQAAMPVITQAALAARACGADHRYATVMISASNLASLAVLPLYMAIFKVLFKG